MEIIVDNRERAIIPYMEEYSQKYNIDYTIKTITTGDYAICYKGYIIIIIERKTYADLAASMRDGRKENINKLISLRKSTNCHIIYMIEGDAFPKPDKLYSRLPFKNLQSHLDHIAFRDNIHIIYTKNQLATAERLFILARNYGTIKPSMLKTVDEKINGKTGGGSSNDSVDDNIKDNNQDGSIDDNIKDNNQDGSVDDNLDAEQDVEKDVEHDSSTTDNQDDNQANDIEISYEEDEPNIITRFDNLENDLSGGNMTELTKKQISCINIQEKILRCLPGIGSVIATILAENNITMYGIYKSYYTIDGLARLKFQLGASLGLERATKIFNLNKLLSSSKSKIAASTRLAILAAIPGVSKITAGKILEKIKFDKLMSGDITVDQLKDFQRRESSKLGVVVATKILDCLIPNKIPEDISEPTKDAPKRKKKTKSIGSDVDDNNNENKDETKDVAKNVDVDDNNDNAASTNKKKEKPKRITKKPKKVIKIPAKKYPKPVNDTDDNE